MIERATYDLLRIALRLAIQLWPLWLFWFVWSLFDDAWRDFLLTFPDRSTQAFALAYDGGPAVGPDCRYWLAASDPHVPRSPGCTSFGTRPASTSPT